MIINTINKRKKFIAILIAAVMLVLAGFLLIYFFQNNNPVTNDNYSKAGDVKLSASTFQIPEGSVDVAFYGENAYVLYPTVIVEYNLTTGKERQFAAGYNNLTAICAGKNGVYAYDGDKYAVYSFDISGNAATNYDFSQKKVNVREMKVYRDTLVLCSVFSNTSGFNESAFHKINLLTGEVNKIEGNFKGSDSYCLVNAFEFQDENTLLIAGSPSASATADTYKLYKFDLKKEKTLLEWEIPYPDSMYYDNKSGTLYYIAGVNISKYDFELMAGMKTSAVTKADYKSDDINEFSLFFNKIVCDGNNYILWSQRNNLIIVKEPLATDKSIVIYKPKLFGEANALKPIISENIINQFKVEYGCDVYIIEYNNDVYADKIRTKLLANDIDFDIFLLSDPGKDMFLNSILVNGAYEPLNSYDGIIANFANMFDSTEQIMTYNGNVFAVPLDISPSTNYEITENFALYGYEIPKSGWTFDDLWALCDEIISRDDENLSVFPYNIYHTFLLDYVQNAINSSNLDKNTLKNLLTQIRKYADARVLFGSKSLFAYSCGWNYFFYFSKLYQQSETKPYPEYGIIPLPSLDGTVYSRLLKCAMINKYSQNKEMAANFLEVLTQNKNLCGDMLSDTVLTKNFEAHYMYKSWTEDELLYLKKGNELLKGSKLLTFDATAFTDFTVIGSQTSDVGNDLFSGKISINEATDLIYNYVYYLCFE